MSNRIKRLVLFAFSLSLVLALCSVVAFANGAQVGQENAQQSVDSVSEQINSNKDSIEYVYIDKSVVSQGSENNIAIGLANQAAKITQAHLTVVLGQNAEEKMILDASNIQGNTVLFKSTFDQTTSYKISQLEYCLEGALASNTVDFTTDSDESLVFDVVTEEAAKAFSEEKVSEDGTSAFIMDENGSMKATSSVEEALSIADNKPEANACSTVGNEETSADAIVGTREEFLIVAIDPGHGGSDSGACGYGLEEKTLNLSISQYMSNELNTYTGVYPYMVRTTDEYVGLQERVDRAANMKADVFVCIHNNSGGGTGAEVWAPNDSSYNYGTHEVGTALANKIVQNLAALGLRNRGVKTRDSETGATYPDGHAKDYYAVIRAAREINMPAVIVEHAFIDNASDAQKLASDEFRNSLGVADAQGVAEQYNIGKASTAQASSLVAAQAHVQRLGWENAVYDGKVAGTTGKSLRLEALNAKLQNTAAQSSGIKYCSYTNNVWSNWAADGQQCGTVGQGKNIEALKMELTGNAANNYDLYYRVHSAQFGWLGWAKNGEEAGTMGYECDAQAFEMVLVSKGGAAPGSTADHVIKKGDTRISYSVHAQTYGWLDSVGNGVITGTIGESKRLEALKINLDSGKYSGGMSYSAHVQQYGWMNPVSSGQVAGTEGEGKRVEALKINLTGDVSNIYDIYYRVHVQNIGWLDWAKNGAEAGSAGYSYRMEAVQIILQEKGSPAPGSTTRPFATPLVKYQTHVQTYGWRDIARDGVISGTEGESKRMEALTVALDSGSPSGSIQYKAHVQGIGWEQNWASDGSQCGTVGSGLRLEAMQVQLQGDVAAKYDVYYRVHAQQFGWMGWAKNAEYSGTEGFSYRLEALQIVFVEKGGPAPGPTENAFVKNTASNADIMGAAKTNVDQMVRCFESTGHTYPSWEYVNKGAPTINDFCRLVYEEACAEGVRPEILFSQAMYETGWLGFGGDVQAWQCNFGGLGATGGGAGGAVFPNVATGLLAQSQHLKAYACTDPLNKQCVDPRFNLVERGCAPRVYDLNGKWAVPGIGYGEGIMAIVNKTLAS